MFELEINREEKESVQNEIAYLEVISKEYEEKMDMPADS